MMPTQSQIQRKKRGLGRKEEGKEKRDGVTEGRRQTTVQKAERERWKDGDWRAPGMEKVAKRVILMAIPMPRQPAPAMAAAGEEQEERE
jgi:hypothetical protein